MEENVQNGDNMPSIESIMKAIENMPDLPEEDKKQLIANLLQRQQLGDDAPFASLNPENIENVVGGTTNTFLDVAILLSLISIILLILVFFGYKLYKSLAERERRKEEKKRQKQQKKKK